MVCLVDGWMGRWCVDDWVIGFLVAACFGGWLGWTGGWLSGWFGMLVGWLIGWLVECLAVSNVECIVDG